MSSSAAKVFEVLKAGAQITGSAMMHLGKEAEKQAIHQIEKGALELSSGIHTGNAFVQYGSMQNVAEQEKQLHRDRGMEM